MAIPAKALEYTTKSNTFYRKYFHFFLYILIVMMLMILVLVGALLYQVIHRPLPPISAIDPEQHVMTLQPFEDPSMLPDTIIRFASKAAVAAYTLDFGRYEQQLESVHPYFTNAGWESFRGAMRGIVADVVKRKLFVNGVVVGTPVISNQGELPGKGYVWRVQIPFLGSYSTGEVGNDLPRRFFVIISIVKVPTSQNPQGMGIDQFIMSG